MNTISSNLPEMAKGVKMLAALMDDEGANGDDLMMAAKQVHLLTFTFCEKSYTATLCRLLSIFDNC